MPKYLNVPLGTFRVLFQAGLLRRHALGTGELSEVFYTEELDKFLASILQNSRDISDAGLASAGFFPCLSMFDEVRPFAAGEALRGLTIGQAVSKLHTNDRVLKGLIKVGAIQTVKQRHPVARNMQTIITHEEIARFNHEFVSLFILARQRGKHMPILLQELQALGVQPAPELEGIGATFFRRSEVPL